MKFKSYKFDCDLIIGNLKIGRFEFEKITVVAGRKSMGQFNFFKSDLEFQKRLSLNQFNLKTI